MSKGEGSAGSPHIARSLFGSFRAVFHIHLLFSHAAKTANKWSSHSHAFCAIHPRALHVGQTQLIHPIRPPNRSRVLKASGPR